MNVGILKNYLEKRIFNSSYFKFKFIIETGKFPILIHILGFWALRLFNCFIICSVKNF